MRGRDGTLGQLHTYLPAHCVCVPLWVLIPKLKESSGNTSVLTSVLVAVGELVQVPGPEMAEYADDLFGGGG